LLFNLLTPPFIISCIGVLLILRWLIAACKLVWRKERDGHVRLFKDLFLELAFLALFVMYISFYEVILMCFEVFATDSEGYFEKFPWLRWNTSASSDVVGLKLVAAIFSVLYGLGIPAVVFLLLRSYRAEIQRTMKAEHSSEPHDKLFFAFIYENYTPKFYFFEMAWIFRRLAIASTVMIPKWGANRLLGSLLVLFVLLGFMCIEHVLAPFARPAENTMNLIGSSVLVITFAFQTWVVFAVGNNADFSFTTYAPVAFYLATSLSIGYILLLVFVTIWPVIKSSINFIFRRCCSARSRFSRSNPAELHALLEEDGAEPSAVHSSDSSDSTEANEAKSSPF
jgi:hypothetical protein